VVDQGRISTLTGCVTVTSPLRRPVGNLHRGWVWLRGWLGLGADCAATRPMEKNAARSARAPLKNGAAVDGSRFKMLRESRVSVYYSLVRRGSAGQALGGKIQVAKYVGRLYSCPLLFSGR